MIHFNAKNIMDTKLKLEIVIPSEAEEIRNIMIKIVDNESLRWFKNGEKPYVPGYKSIDMQKYHTWDNKYFKIIYDNNIAGVILISHTGKEHGRIDRFYILPEYQNIGLGSKVLKLAEELFPNVNIWSLDTTTQSPRNHHFYEKNGYVLCGQDDEERYYTKEKEVLINESKNYYNSKDLSNAKFYRCNMKAVDLYDSNMSNSRFSNMGLDGIIYSNSNLKNNRFTNTNISNSIFADSNMSKVEICHSSLEGAYIHDINLDVDKENCSITMERCELTNSSIIDSNLQGLKIENCNTDGMMINGISLADMMDAYKKLK